MSNKDFEIFLTAGNISEELESTQLENIYGGSSEPRRISEDNDGKQCTITWECSICPTHTCFC